MWQYWLSYWLKLSRNIDTVNKSVKEIHTTSTKIGKRFEEISNVKFELEINGESLSFEKPVIYKRNDPVMGEVYRPFVIAPPVFATVSGDVMIFANHASQNVQVDVQAGMPNVKGLLSLKLPSSSSA